jgi:hypothetical protein
MNRNTARMADKIIKNKNRPIPIRINHEFYF